MYKQYIGKLFYLLAERELFILNRVRWKKVLSIGVSHLIPLLFCIMMEGKCIWNKKDINWNLKKKNKRTGCVIMCTIRMHRISSTWWWSSAGFSSIQYKAYANNWLTVFSVKAICVCDGYGPVKPEWRRRRREVGREYFLWHIFCRPIWIKALDYIKTYTYRNNIRSGQMKENIKEWNNEKWITNTQHYDMKHLLYVVNCMFVFCFLCFIDKRMNGKTRNVLKKIRH